MPRQRAPYGCIEQVARGKWRIRWWADLHDGKGYTRRSHTLCGSRRDASAWLAKMQAEHGTDAPTMTVGEVYTRWYLPYCEERQAPNTLSNTLAIWRNHVGPRWAAVPAPDVRPLAVQEWLDGMRSRVTAQNSLRVLAAVLDYAMRYEIVPVNVARLDYVMPTGGRERDKGVYKYAEVAQIADALEEDSLFCAFCLSALGSCRTGEALAALASEVYEVVADNGMQCAVVPIHQQVTQGCIVQPTLKTKQSERPVVIPEPWSLRVLDVARARVAEGLPYLADNGVGGVVDKKAMRRLFDAECRRHGWARHPWANLRNSWRTYMEWELGADPEKLEKMMGHTGHSVTARHYNRPDAEVFAEVVSVAFRDNLGRGN